MKKTLVLTHDYYPHRGGVGRYVYNLFKYFKESDYLVVTDNKYVKTNKNTINIRLTYPLIKPSWLLSYLKIKLIIKKYKIEQIFTPNILPLGSMAYFLKIPYFISLHGLDINLALKNRPKLTAKILLGAKHIIVNSLQTKKSLDALSIDEKKISLIYPSIDFVADCDEYKLAAFKNKIGLKDNDKVLLTVGRLVKRKGQDVVINAVSYLKDDFDIKYFIVGSGENEKHLKDLIEEKKLHDKVFIYEKIDDEELAYFYKMADIFVMPSIHSQTDTEGFGMVFLEAAASALPIIGGQEAGINEVFEEDKEILFVKNGDLRQLVRHIKTLLNKPDFAAKLAVKAFAKYQQFNNCRQNSDRLKKILS